MCVLKRLQALNVFGVATQTHADKLLEQVTADSGRKALTKSRERTASKQSTQRGVGKARVFFFLSKRRRRNALTQRFDLRFGVHALFGGHLRVGTTVLLPALSEVDNPTYLDGLAVLVKNKLTLVGP